MSNAIGFQCVECARRFTVAEIEYVCTQCGGNLDVLYDYEKMATQFDKARLAADRNFTMWRYRALLPMEDSSPVPPLTVGWTPIYDCPALAAHFNLKQLFIKDDGRNPTASFKDRPSALAVVKAQEVGAQVITTASSGNAGCALAGMCASVGMPAVVFVPASAPAAKIAQLQIYGARVVLVEGSYDEAYDLCLQAARTYGWYQRSTGVNPFMTEGKKTAALEISEQLHWQVPDKIFVSVGDGCIIGGLWKGFCDLEKLGMIERLPQLIGVQSEKASALVDAINGDGVVRESAAATLADSINVGRPRDATKALRAMRESQGGGVTVSDEAIIESIGKLACATGVFVEPAAAAAFAGFAKWCEAGQIKADERVLLMLTGNGLKDIQAAQQALNAPLRVRPNFAEVERALADSGFSLPHAH
ncbi:MAG: threonine synthase [Acidobacteria bacterium]|nr:threonine synthase [Acidobacteriota bacterium]